MLELHPSVSSNVGLRGAVQLMVREAALSLTNSINSSSKDFGAGRARVVGRQKLTLRRFMTMVVGVPGSLIWLLLRLPAHFKQERRGVRGEEVVGEASSCKLRSCAAAWSLTRGAGGGIHVNAQPGRREGEKGGGGG